MKTVFIKPLLFITTFFLFFGLISCRLENKTAIKPNVLMIIVDDLRPELNCYGDKQIHSPNIDKIAGQGVYYTSAYCNVPVCGASRASLMTGVRPGRYRFIDYDAWADKDMPDVVCLPQHFKNNGYYTISNGKIFHHQEDRKESWDENWRPQVVTTWRDYQLPENIALDSGGRLRGPAYECGDVDDSAYFDGKIANKSINDLRKLKQSGKPFFLAVGFLKPHLPFNAPKKYWDLYDYNNIHIPDNYIPSESIPRKALHNWGELRAYSGIPAKGPLKDSAARKLIQGYYACVSYTDSQIGKVMDALKELGLDENTIVILFGDHGWNLGEHGLWCKHCNFYTSLRSTLIVKVPGMTTGSRANALVEYIDIYPTLSELCHLDPPGHLEGRSFVPVLKNPDLSGKEFVISKWFDGLTISRMDYAYTEWRDSNDSIYENMLFDHRIDIGENNNLSKSGDFEKEVNDLSEELFQNRGADFFSGKSNQ